MLQRSVTLTRRLRCVRPSWSVSGDVLRMVLGITMDWSASRATRLRWIRFGGTWMDPFARAVGPVLLLPDWHVALERVNQPLAGGKGVRAVGRADDDRHAGLGQRHPAQAVHDQTFYKRPAAAGLGFQLSQLFLGHFVVCLVIERHGPPARGELAGRTQ